MSNLSTDIIVMLLVLCLPSIIIGYLICVKQKRQLMAGWDESKVAKPEAFAKLVGGSFLFMGIGIGLLAIGKGVGRVSEVPFVCVMSVLTLVPIFCLIVAHKKYGKRN